MQYVNGVSTVYIRKFQRKLEQYNKPGPLPEYFAPMIGDKKKVRIAEVAAGPINTIGNFWPGVEVEIVASDILQPEYEKLWKEHKATPVVPVQYADMESLPYEDESFDIVHCVNALDHTKDARKALSELKRICKKGGWVYLRHAPDQKKRFGGQHYWDARFINGGCQFHGDHSIIIQAFDCFDTRLENDLIVSTWQRT